VLKQHRLLVDRRFPAYETTFTLSAAEQVRWLDLFETSAREIPFTYHTTVGTMVLMRVVGDVGVNFKNLLHLKCEMAMAPEHPMVTGQTYRLAAQVEESSRCATIEWPWCARPGFTMPQAFAFGTTVTSS
jgi:hypothetical protein